MNPIINPQVTIIISFSLDMGNKNEETSMSNCVLEHKIKKQCQELKTKANPTIREIYQAFEMILWFKLKKDKIKKQKEQKKKEELKLQHS